LRELRLDLFKGAGLGLGIEEEHHQELKGHHGREEDKRRACERAAINGKTPAIRAFMIQCDEDPRLCPFERTREGKASAM
jgi:hypothetical protein